MFTAEQNNATRLELILSLATFLRCEAQYRMLEKAQVGPTDYIDRIPLHWVGAKALLYGLDPHGREYVSFALDAEWGDGTTKTQVVTAFQRYVDSPLWVCNVLGITVDGFDAMVAALTNRLRPDYPLGKWELKVTVP